MYVLVALVGGALLLTDVPNISISGMAFSISIVVPFLNMTKQFAGAIGQVSNQVNMVIMGLAGAHRIFALLDEQPEADEGYVTLVNARENADGSMSECEERTNVWAWKHRHHDGTTTYTRLQGDVRFTMSILDTRRKRLCCTIFPCMQNLARRWLSSDLPARAKLQLQTSLTAFTTLTTARSVMTGLISIR